MLFGDILRYICVFIIPCLCIFLQLKHLKYQMINLSFLFSILFSSPLRFVEQIKSHLKNLYREAAQYDNPPTYPVSVICDAIDHTHSSPNETTLQKIFAGMVAYRGNNSCYNVDTTMLVSDPISSQDQISEGWLWQVIINIPTQHIYVQFIFTIFLHILFVFRLVVR